MKKGLLFTFIVLFCFIPVFSQAAQLKSSYPRLANYYLKWELNSTEARISEMICLFWIWKSALIVRTLLS